MNLVRNCVTKKGLKMSWSVIGVSVLCVLVCFSSAVRGEEEDSSEDAEEIEVHRSFSTAAEAEPLTSTGGVGCRFPGAPAQSSVSFTIPGGAGSVPRGAGSPARLPTSTVATYSCERGFELLGPARRVCTEDGRWTPDGIPFCVLNVAAGKAAMQVSTEQGGSPSKAIDGSTSSFFTADTCTLTGLERSPWWYVNLLEPYMVQLVRLDFGKSCCGKNSPGTIVVRVGNQRPDLGSNPVCNRFTGHLEEGKPLFLPCNPPMPGAFVSVHLEVASGAPPSPIAPVPPSALSICEAFVYTDQALPIERCPQFRDAPPGSMATYNGKCYAFHSQQPANFRDALAFCRARGGTLLDESNPALQGFVSWELWRRHRNDKNGQYWMGAVRDPADRNNWKWSTSGKDVAISFWNLPGGGEDCARFDGAKGWLWSDTNCNARLNFICQHQPKTCGKPEQPPNSTILASRDFEVGSTVDYTCDPGHILIGPASRTCLPTGFYNEFPPVCKRIECGYPADVPNGKYTLVNGTVSYLSRVVYSCQDGYKLIGRSQLICDVDERWNGPPPRCQPSRCGNPPSIANGTFTISRNTTTVGTIVTYSCKYRNLKLVGPRQIVCLKTGQYDKQPPTCQVEKVPSVVIPGVGTGRPSRPPPGVPTSTTDTRLPRPPTSLKPPMSPARPGPQSPPYAVLEEKKPMVVTGTEEEEIEAEVEEELLHREHGPVDVDNGLLPGDSEPAESIGVVTLSPGVRHPTTRPLRPNDIDKDGVSSIIRSSPAPSPSSPRPVVEGGERRRTDGGPKLNLGAIIALGVFGGFVFLAAIITTIVIIVKRNRGTQHYRHRASPDSHTVASFDESSSGSESRQGGLGRFYKQAWENLHESSSQAATAGAKGRPVLVGLGPSDKGLHHHPPLRRKETLDDPSYRMRHSEADVIEKKRHHHHHHHHHGAQPQQHRRSGSSGSIGNAVDREIEWQGRNGVARSQQRSRF
ncbi:uncharacterized protein LOC124159479 isoform X1 [Ischnura elegans]|uniref:uncharacterized protein LOC124159479 isoform X1 n=1 Tax=Ischnura elegans TaxID=197161 RepID=UPI001ED88FB9|nr:uncharacterized protein LOC124159479 isoform X1 [Ischnura elegans]